MNWKWFERKRSWRCLGIFGCFPAGTEEKHENHQSIVDNSAKQIIIFYSSFLPSNAIFSVFRNQTCTNACCRLLLDYLLVSASWFYNSVAAVSQVLKICILQLPVSMSNGIPAVLTWFRCFLQFLQANSWIVPRLIGDRFIPNHHSLDNLHYALNNSKYLERRWIYNK
jgi:hypothetical protein